MRKNECFERLQRYANEIRLTGAPPIFLIAYVNAAELECFRNDPYFIKASGVKKIMDETISTLNEISFLENQYVNERAAYIHEWVG